MPLAPAPLRARLGPLAVFAACGYLAAALPCWLHGMPGAGRWSCLSAAAAAGAGLVALRQGGAHRPRRQLACIAAVGAAVSLDFAIASPLAILARCGGALDPVTAHLRLFPATSLAMLALACCHDVPRSVRGWLRVLGAFALMLAAMSLFVRGFERLAPVAGWSWDPNGMTSAMVVGMALFACTPPLPWRGNVKDRRVGSRAHAVGGMRRVVARSGPRGHKCPPYESPGRH